tara:strand:- start:465 stop:1484 length:1020 start_codon:yes stop_codon:yes gene_type:complete
MINEVSETGTLFDREMDRKGEIFVNSGSDALYAALVGLNISGKVVVPAYTYIATVNAILRANCEPVFVDVGLDGLMGLDNISKVVPGEDITAVVYPTIGGNFPAQAEEIRHYCGNNDVKLIHDGAQSYGSTFYTGPGSEQSRRSWGDIGIVSYDPTKVVGNMIGTGGGIFVRDPDLRAKICSFVNQGYLNGHAGINSKMSRAARKIIDYNKAIHYEENHTARRARVCEQYYHIPGSFFQEPGTYSNHSRATFKFDNTSDRKWVQNFLKAKQIESKVYYQTPAYRYPQSEPFVNDINAFPKTDNLGLGALSIPLYPELTDKQIDRIVDAMSEAINIIRDK